MKKTDVYVVVDTPKKAKKLKKVLDMFGEDHTGEAIGDNYYNGVKLFNDTWCAIRTKSEIKDETEVSIKELRNILAKEHLNQGDVCLFEDKGYKVLGRYKQYSNVFKDFVCDKIEGNSNTTTGFHNFIRYATEEEKALLEPKKELEVGKWYRFKNNNLVFTTSELSGGHVSGYGFAHGGTEWIDEYPYFLVESFKEAAPQEVEIALIGEAKRRGFDYDDIVFEDITNILWGNYNSDIDGNEEKALFNNGKWATVIEQDNFTDYDIAIVERLHDTLLDNHGYSLKSELLIDARMLANKIKSNIK